MGTKFKIAGIVAGVLVVGLVLTACSAGSYDDGIFHDAALARRVRISLGLQEQAQIDVDQLKSFTNLKADSLGIKDLTGMQYFTNLQSLDLGRNQISDLAPLAGLTALESLRLNENKISDVSPLAGLTGLKYLDLDRNVIAEVAPLASLVNLENLFLAQNMITDGTPLKDLPAYDTINWIGNKTDMEGNPR